LYSISIAYFIDCFGSTLPPNQPKSEPSNNTARRKLSLNNGYSSAASKGGADRNLMDQTIMEEMDSDY
jgi:hypothetical protein